MFDTVLQKTVLTGDDIKVCVLTGTAYIYGPKKVIIDSCISQTCVKLGRSALCCGERARGPFTGSERRRVNST